MENKIITINTNNKNNIDLSLLDDYMNENNYKNKLCKLLKDVTYDTAKSVINKARLKHLKFSLTSEPDFDDFEHMNVVLVATDDEYCYLISIFFNKYNDVDFEDDVIDLDTCFDDSNTFIVSNEFDLEELVPDYTYYTLSRYRLEEDNDTDNNPFMTYEEYFNESTGNWESTSPNNKTLKSVADQIDLFLNYDSNGNESMSNLLMEYFFNCENSSVENFDNVVNSNSKIVELYSQTYRYTLPSFVKNDDEFIKIKLSLGYTNGGLSITYDDECYCLNAIDFNGETIKTVFKTQNQEEMIDVMTTMFDKQYYYDTLSIIPLSNKALLLLRQNGNVEVFRFKNLENPYDKNKELNKEEKALMEKCMCDIEKYFDAFESEEEDF